MKTVISQCEHWTDNLAEFEENESLHRPVLVTLATGAVCITFEENESLHRPVQYKINDDNGALKVAETSALV